MRSLSLTQQQHILTLLDSNHSAHQIATIIGCSVSTISRLHSKHRFNLSKLYRGHLLKLSFHNIQHTVHLITSKKAENAVQVAKTLSTIIDQPLHPNIICRCLKESGMKAIVKKKQLLLSAKHRKARLDFAIAYKDWTIED